jgi:hypothetical protein
MKLIVKKAEERSREIARFYSRSLEGLIELCLPTSVSNQQKPSKWRTFRCKLPF